MLNYKCKIIFLLFSSPFQFARWRHSCDCVCRWVK